MPSNGKHALLIVNKLMYDRLLIEEERKKEKFRQLEDAKTLEEKSENAFSQPSCKLMPIDGFLSPRVPYNEGDESSISPRPLERRATPFLSELVASKGDSSDLIEDESYLSLIHI
eukprot:TRINITY_DN35717_c0_g1_i2.p1 TRINITY_DN35717_c0_g1~~TRINITY_DN35717_c0_g1_i2.p1  ORF type:complete len:115 (-),score=17.74 TRINITY_DN35717_c0_g1_i2:129-473(-)